jgi:hypothetical protein
MNLNDLFTQASAHSKMPSRRRRILMRRVVNAPRGFASAHGTLSGDVVIPGSVLRTAPE